MDSHHAWLYISPECSVTVLPEGLQRPRVDIDHLVVEQLSIADARGLIARAHQRPVAGSEQHLVIIAQGIQHEAQNALLKLLEEPPAATIFHLVVPDAARLIPTVRSRLVEAAFESNYNTDAFVEFATADYATRLAMIAERTKAKDTVWCESVVTGAQSVTLPPEAVTARKSLLLVDGFIRRRGASKKMLLEELALSWPIGLH